MTRTTALVLAAPMAIAMGGAALGTRHGIGLTPDAVVYLDAARHLAHGDGFVQSDACRGGAATPVTHFPPLFPWVLSLEIRAGLDATTAARALQIALFGINVALVTGLVLARTRSRRAAVVAGLLDATALGMLEVHTAAWSEPLFLVAVEAGLIGSLVALERARAGKPYALPLVAGAVALGAGALTRYVGGAVVAAVVAAQVAFGPGERWRRARRAAAVAAVAAVPLGAFLLRNAIVAGQATDRVAGWRAIGAPHLGSLALTMGSWLLPGADRVPQLRAFDGVFGAAGVVLGLAVAVVAAPGRGRPRDLAVALHRLVAGVYVLVLLGSIACFDHATPLDQRNLAAVFQACLVALILALSGPHGSRLAAGVGPRPRAVLALALVTAYGASFAGAVHYLWRHGRGYLAPGWSYPRLYARVAALPADTAILSNVPEAAQWWTGHRACALPASHGSQGSQESRDGLHRETSPAAVLYFEEPRRFTPRVVGDTSDPGPGLDAARAFARVHGLADEERERNAVLLFKP